MNPVKIVRNLSPFGWDVAMKNDCFMPKGESKGDFRTSFGILALTIFRIFFNFFHFLLRVFRFRIVLSINQTKFGE